MLFNCKRTISITFISLLWLLISGEVAKADVYDSIRYKWAGFLIGADGSITDKDIIKNAAARDAEASRYVKMLAASAIDNQTPWKDLTYQYSKDITTGYRRLMVMALAYQVTNGKLYHDSQLRSTILYGLKWLYDHQYNERTPLPIPSEGSDVHNWWDYKIGTPLILNDIVVLLYNDLTAEQRATYMAAIDHFTPDWTDRYTRKPAVVQFTAANRVWICRVIAVRALILKNSSLLKAASDTLASVFQDTKAGDGFYADGSFIQHVKHPYNGGYGVSLLTNLTEEIHLFAQTPWAIKSEQLNHLYGWIYQAFAPLIFKGNMMSMVEGREISRPDAQGDRKGALVVQAIALLAKSAPLPDKARLCGLVKYWFKDRTIKPDFYGHVSENYIPLVKQLFTDTSPVEQPKPYLYRQFANMDRAVQQTPEYAFGISMYSARIYNYETRTNYENIKGWHTADGATYLYNADLEQYNDDYWATVNYFHLPGITVEEGTKVPGFKNSSKYWVGGATLLDRYGVSGMDLATPGQTLTAKKSWFMLDGKIVALGAAIASQDSAQVNTYIEQRRLKTDDSNAFSVNGQTGNFSSPTKNVKWAHLSGNVPGADIGYYFPESITLQSSIQPQSGSWHDVNVNYSNKVVTQPYLTLWQNQTNKTNSYAYILLPGLSKEQVASYAAKPDVQIISNSDKVQAVYDAGLQLTAANFWQSFTIQAGGITCSGQAAVMVMKQADTLHIALSDPTMCGGEITLKFKDSALRTQMADPSIQVLSLSPFITLRFNGKELSGRTANVVLVTSK